MKKLTDFANYMTRFFSVHLAGVRNLSKNTIVSYRDTFRLLLLFCQDICSIKPEKLPDWNKDENLLNFLENL